MITLIFLCRSYDVYRSLIDLTQESPDDMSGSGTDDELPKVEFSLAPQRDLEERY